MASGTMAIGQIGEVQGPETSTRETATAETTATAYQQ